MDLPYFAYGSNLHLRRLRERVPGARLLGTASLPGHELRWHKRGVDGSGKCNVVPSARAGAIVHGAVFLIPLAEKPGLDRAESAGTGYDERTVSVAAMDGTVTAFTYVATESHVDDALRPFTWYRDLVVAGAESLELPGDYLAGLRSVLADPDPDRGRDRKNRSLLAASPPRR